MAKNTLIDQLLIDHRNIARIMGIVQGELKNLEQSGNPDYHLLELCTEYLIQFSDKVHHPSEDKMFAALREVDPASEKIVIEIEKEHVSLARLNKQMDEFVKAVQTGHIVKTSAFSARIRDFIQAQYDHMRKEESVVFPMAIDSLSDSQWQSLNASIGPILDPVFGRDRSAFFQYLYGTFESR